MLKTIKQLLLPSFLLWLVPFMISIPFFNQSGNLIIDFWLFKAIMLVVGTLTALFVLSRHYTKYVYSYHVSTFILLSINCILDLIILVGLFQMSIGEWALTVLPMYIVFIPLSNAFVFWRLSIPFKKVN